MPAHTLTAVKVDFAKYAAVLLDLDGTIYHEEHPLPGAVELIRRLQRERIPFAGLSNSTTSPARLSQRLARMGVAAPADCIYTAAAAAADFVMRKFAGDGRLANTAAPPIIAAPTSSSVSSTIAAHPAVAVSGAPASLASAIPDRARRPRVFNLSTEGVHEMLDGLVDWVQTDGEPCDALIIGALTNVYATEPRNRIGLRLLRKGAMAVGICADRVFPSQRGLEFGAGAFTAMLCYAANTTPTFCGKPQAIFFNEACARMKVDPKQALLVGDNLESDIAGGKAVGMKTMLTLTGVTRQRDLIAAPKEMHPDLIVEDLTHLE